MSLFESAPKPDPAATRRLKDWTRELLALDEDVAVTVNEVRCADEDCPDVETVIGALYGQGRPGLWRIDAPAAEVTREQLAAVIAGSPPAPLVFQRPTKNNNHPRT